MSERTSALQEYMQQQHAKSWPVLESLEPDDMGVAVYSEGEQVWTVRDLLGHLADGERGNLGQVQRLVAGRQTVPEDFDLNRWNRSAVRKNAQLEPDQLLQNISEHYQRALDFAETLSDDDLELIGRHASGKMLTAEGFLKRMADHRVEHTADIQAALDR